MKNIRMVRAVEMQVRTTSKTVKITRSRSGGRLAFPVDIIDPRTAERTRIMNRSELTELIRNIKRSRKIGSGMQRLVVEWKIRGFLRS